MPLVRWSVPVCASSQNELELAKFELSTVKDEKDIVVDGKIPVDGSNATPRMPAAVFQGFTKLFKYSRKLCAFTSQRKAEVK